MPEAEPTVAAFRARYAATSVARRIPAHITLLIPFVPAVDLDEGAVAAARDHFAATRPIDGALVSIGSFPEHVWLAPSPREAFAELIRKTCGRFPESPYGREFPDPVPHLTIGQADDEVTVEEIVRAAEREIAPRLPVRFRAASAWLLVEQVEGAWAREVEFPFGS